MPKPADYDLIVAGGGPAGSTLASLVAMRGHRVLLVEKENFPRYQIGESLLPTTVHGVCRLLGVFDELAACEFTLKHGGTFRWGSSPDPWSFHFGDLPAFAGAKSYAYQVERMRFDHVLLNNARRVGVEVREGCTAGQVINGTGRVEGLVYTDADQRVRRAYAPFVADASGHRGKLHRGMPGERRYSDFFRNIALFGYFENGKRLPAPNAGNILCVAFEEGWIWYIPLSPRLTSVGAVVRQEAAAKIQGDPAAALARMIAACPLISEHLADASRLTDGPYGQVRVRRDYSYCHERFRQPGMVLTGDAACFVDPVLSTGVHLATYGSLLAARAINASLAGTVPEEHGLAEFERRYRSEYTYFYKFLRAFYTQNATEKSYFWEAKRLTGSALTDIVAFVELVAGAASGEPVLVAADEYAHSYAARAAAEQAGTAGMLSSLSVSPDGLAWEPAIGS